VTGGSSAGFDHDRSIIPEGFEAYARLLHPAESHGPDGRRWRWSDIAGQNGREVHTEMLFETISQPSGGVASDDDWGEPELGSLPLPERAVLVDLLGSATTTPDDCWFCVWDGFGGLDDQGVSARVRLPEREYLLRRGPIEAATDPTPRRRGPGSMTMIFTQIPAPGAPAPKTPVLPDLWWKDQSPNLWWPADRAWIVATEIDHTWTYIGGPAVVIRSVLDHPDLEALPIELTAWF
jgi:hypothetical protein